MKIKNILFDFDGVILDSIPVKTNAFEKLFEGFDKDEIDQILQFHLSNGGMPRFDKIRYFFEVIRGEKITADIIGTYASKFSLIVKEELSQAKYQISETVQLIRNLYCDFNLHIVSGAEEVELRGLCNSHQLTKYFISIHGSPTIKSELIKGLLERNEYSIGETLLIGDSMNDLEAARKNGILFVAYNNPDLKGIDRVPYLESALDLQSEVLE